jgi:S-adenosyl methyltransferase
MANTHQVAHRTDPDARVVYVDLDPVVSTHAAALMAGPKVVTLRADLREPKQVLGDQRVRGLLDFASRSGSCSSACCTACGTRRTRGAWRLCGIGIKDQMSA